MALSAELGKSSVAPDFIETNASLTMDRFDAGWTVTTIHLDVTARIPGGNREKFKAAADSAKAGHPVSRLLNTRITMDARLAG